MYISSIIVYSAVPVFRRSIIFVREYTWVAERFGTLSVPDLHALHSTAEHATND